MKREKTDRKNNKMPEGFMLRVLCLAMGLAICFSMAACGDDSGKEETRQQDVSTKAAIEEKEQGSEKEKEPENEEELPASEEETTETAREHVQELNYDIRESTPYSEWDVLTDDAYLKSALYDRVQKKGEELAAVITETLHQKAEYKVIGVFRVPNGIISESDSGLYVYRVDFGFTVPEMKNLHFSDNDSLETDGTYIRFKTDWYCYSYITTEYETAKVIADEFIYWKDSGWIDENCYSHEKVTAYGNRYEAAAFTAFDYYRTVIKAPEESEPPVKDEEAMKLEAKAKIKEYFGGEYDIQSFEYIDSVGIYEGSYACCQVDGDYVVLGENIRTADSDEYYSSVEGLVPAIEVGDYREAVYDVFFGITDVQAAICYEPYGYFAAYGARAMFFGADNASSYGDNNKKLDLPIWEGGSENDYYYTEGVNHLYNLMYHSVDQDGNAFDYYMKTVATNMARTYRGVTFGDSREKVLELYPEISTEPNSNIDEERDYVWYTKYPDSLGGDVLVIVFEDDKVTELQSVHLYGYL